MCAKNWRSNRQTLRGEIYYDPKPGKGVLASPRGRERQTQDYIDSTFGLFQIWVMFFKVSGTPATIQDDGPTHIGMEALTGAYLDDLVIYSQTWEKHPGHAWCMLQQLCEAGLTANPVKCQFAMAQCSYLGHIVGNGKVYPGKE